MMGQPGPDGLEYCPEVETYLVHSQHVNQTFKIQVMRPIQKRGEVLRLPTLYATDGNLAFDVLKGLCWSAQMSGHLALRFVLVGIGYPTDSPLSGTLLRMRDLTFPGYPQLCTEAPPWEDVLVPDRGAKLFCGAEEFQQFLADELVPFIEERCGTRDQERTYFGHSLGAGFGLFTLFTRPDLFRNYILSSPGLIYHGQSSAGIRYEEYDFVLQQARRAIASGLSLSGRRVYMSVGEEEEFEPLLAQWRFTSSFYRMVSLLKSAAIPGLELTAEVFPGETHMAAWPMAFNHGVRNVLRSAGDP